MTKTSRYAVAAATGLLLSMSAATAADLGGNCCADLEERIAELESTTARKGNRKVSLTVSGQVHRIMLFWGDGSKHGQYYGLDNTNSSSRFRFTGAATISPRMKAGFEIEIEVEAGGTSSKVSQLDEDGKLGSQINGVGGVGGSFNASNVDAYFGDARRTAFWIEDSTLGRVTLGRFESAGVVQTIDLGGIGAAASASFSLINGSFFVRNGAGNLTAMRWANIMDPAAAQGRTELIRWDSPTWHGFILSSSIAEAGDYWGAMMRYANEFNGVRLAGGFGYENVSDRATPGGLSGLAAAPTAVVVNPTASPFTVASPSVESWGGALSLLHVASGVFVQGHYTKTIYGGGSSSGYWNQLAAVQNDATHWLIQAGIARNHFGIGNTAFYAEYGETSGFGSSSAGNISYAATGLSANSASTGLAGFDAIGTVIDSNVKVWGLGLVQNIDAAATELYVGYRRFEADVTLAGGAKADLKDFDAVAVGARIKF